MSGLISSILNWHSLTNDQKIEIKRQLFNITDQKIIDKIIFGFFIDRFEPVNKQEFKQLEELSHLGFMAGSLTSKEFVKLLEEFLSQDESKKAFTLETLAILKEYIEAVKSAQSQGNLVDFIRSSEFRLILKATTGATFWGVEQTTSTSSGDVDKLTAQILQDIQSMKKGDSKLFLIGTLLHETRMNLEKVGDHTFRLTYFDTASDNTVQIHQIEESKLLDRSFWRPLFEAKLGQMNKSTEETCKWIQSYLKDQAFETLDPEKAGMISKQKQNTCHFRSLYAPLKIRIIEANRDNGEGGYYEWHRFKLAFGAYLLTKKKEGSSSHTSALQTLSEQKQHLQEKKSALRLEVIEAASDENKYQGALDSFREAFALFDPVPTKMNQIRQNPHGQSRYHALRELTRELITQCRAVGIRPEDMASHFQKIPHPLIQKAFKLFSEQAEKSRESVLSGEFYQQFEEKNVVEKLFSNLWSKISSQTASESSLTLPPLSNKEIDSLMDKIAQKPIEEVIQIPEEILLAILRRALRVGFCEKVHLLLDEIFFEKIELADRLFANVFKDLEIFLPAIAPPSEWGEKPRGMFFEKVYEKLRCIEAVQNNLASLIPIALKSTKIQQLITYVKNLPPSKFEEAISVALELEKRGGAETDQLARTLIIETLLSIYRQNPAVNLEPLTCPFSTKVLINQWLSTIDTLVWLQNYAKGNFKALVSTPDIYNLPTSISFDFTEDNYQEGLSIIPNVPIFLAQIVIRDLLAFAAHHPNSPGTSKILGSIETFWVNFIFSAKELSSPDLLKLLQSISKSALYKSSNEGANIRKIVRDMVNTILSREDRGIDDSEFHEIEQILPELLKTDKQLFVLQSDINDKLFKSLKSFLYRFPETNLARLYHLYQLSEKMENVETRFFTDENSLMKFIGGIERLIKEASPLIDKEIYRDLFGGRLLQFCPSKEAFKMMRPMYERIMQDPQTPVTLKKYLESMAIE